MRAPFYATGALLALASRILMVLVGFYSLGMLSVSMFCFGFGVVGFFVVVCLWFFVWLFVVVLFVWIFVVLVFCSGFLFGCVCLLISNIKISF